MHGPNQYEAKHKAAAGRRGSLTFSILATELPRVTLSRLRQSENALCAHKWVIRTVGPINVVDTVHEMAAG